MSQRKKILTGIIIAEVIVLAGIIAFLFYINSDAVRINRQLGLAQRYLLEEDYEQAIAMFEVVIDIDPTNEEAYLGLAEAYMAMDDLTRAVKILERGTRKMDSTGIQELLDEYTKELAQGSEMESSTAIQPDMPEIGENVTVQDEEQNSGRSHEDLFREYIATTLLPAYGIFEPDQSGTMRFVQEQWFKPAGVMSATILDFDQDGAVEMLVCYTEQTSEQGSYAINMAMYEVSDGKVELASSVPFVAYHDARQHEQWNESITLSDAEWCQMSLNVSAVQVNGTYHIVCEAYRLYGCFADGQSQDYWSMVYQNGELQYAFSFTQTGGGSSDFEYTGYEFEDGTCTNAEIYCTEWYEDEGKALYDTFDSAITAFFDKQGIHIDNVIDHDQIGDKSTILSMEDNDVINLLEFVNKLKSADYSTSTFVFEAASTSYGELSKN